MECISSHFIIKGKFIFFPIFFTHFLNNPSGGHKKNINSKWACEVVNKMKYMRPIECTFDFFSLLFEVDEKIMDAIEKS